MFKIVIPCHGDNSDNLQVLLDSIDCQDYPASKVEVYFAEDLVNDNFKSKLEELGGNKTFVPNKSKKRIHGLKNVCRVLDSFAEKESVIGIIDSDDYLWGKNCFSNVMHEYNNGYDCVWTANEWFGEVLHPGLRPDLFSGWNAVVAL